MVNSSRVSHEAGFLFYSGKGISNSGILVRRATLAATLRFQKASRPARPWVPKMMPGNLLGDVEIGEGSQVALLGALAFTLPA
jgi:hypothetical protein